MLNPNINKINIELKVGSRINFACFNIINASNMLGWIVRYLQTFKNTCHGLGQLLEGDLLSVMMVS